MAGSESRIPGIESASDAGKGALAGLGAAAGAAAGGLDVAAQMAGDVLRGIFGALPWNMDSGAIVEAVSPGLIDVATVVA